MGGRKKRRSGIGDWSVKLRGERKERREEDGREVSRLDELSGELHEIGNKHAAKNLPLPISSAASGRIEVSVEKRVTRSETQFRPAPHDLSAFCEESAREKRFAVVCFDIFNLVSF